jgi:hypothetical protein
VAALADAGLGFPGWIAPASAGQTWWPRIFAAYLCGLVVEGAGSIFARPSAFAYEIALAGFAVTLALSAALACSIPRWIANDDSTDRATGGGGRPARMVPDHARCSRRRAP